MSSSVKSLARRLLPDAFYRRYRRRKVAALIAAYEPREVTHTYGGQVLRVRLADPLAEGWYDRDWPEPTFISFLRERGVLAPGAKVFDVGAHQGVVALMLARAVGETGSVLAIEAEPHNARMATVNRELNDARNLTVMHAAGAARTGVVSFAEGLNGQVAKPSSAASISVPAVTVDGLALEHGTPELVLIDVEGYEGQILEGAVETIAGGSSSFLVEVHETLGAYGGSAQEIARCFADFECFTAAGDSEPFRPLTGLAPSGRFFLAAIAARGRRSAQR